jgi:hypothetical protein
MNDKIDQSPATNSISACVMCKSQILEGATICPICKNYQSAWKRNLHYCATIAGIITVAISLLTYVASTWPEIRKTLCWRDAVEISALDSKNNIVLHNSGDGRVYVSHISLCSKAHGHSGVIFINKTIESKSFLVHDLKESTIDLSKWSTRSISEDSWQKLLSKLHLNENKCVQWHYFVPGDPVYQTIKKFHSSSFHEVPIDAILYFRSGKDDQQNSRNVKLFAVPFINQACVAHNGTFMF